MLAPSFDVWCAHMSALFTFRVVLITGDNKQSCLHVYILFGIGIHMFACTHCLDSGWSLKVNLGWQKCHYLLFCSSGVLQDGLE